VGLGGEKRKERTNTRLTQRNTQHKLQFEHKAMQVWGAEKTGNTGKPATANPAIATADRSRVESTEKSH